MGSWQVTEQAVAAMNNISKQLQNIAAKIHSETEKIKSAFEENHDGMGAHSANIQALIEDVEGTEQDAAIPVQKLVLKLQRAALVRKKHIENNRYGSRSPVNRDVSGTQIASSSGNKAADKTAFRKKIDAEGQRAVRLAWKREKELVLQGKGTRDWTVSQQQELLSRNPP